MTPFHHFTEAGLRALSVALDNTLPDAKRLLGETGVDTIAQLRADLLEEQRERALPPWGAPKEGDI